MKTLKLTVKTNKDNKNEIDLTSKGYTPLEIVGLLQIAITGIADDIRNNKITEPCTKK